jgi:hypothetical protein
MSASLIALANGTANSVVAPVLCGVAVGAATCAARARLVGLRRAAGSRRLGERFGAAMGEAVAFICTLPTIS